jgi:hypothetical protein
VLDEVGYALTKKKVVVPVLFETCEVPYRLNRLQYVDARTDYDGAVRALVSTLQDTKDAGALPDRLPIDRTGRPEFATRPGLVAAIALAVIVLAASVVGLVVRSRVSPAAPSPDATTAPGNEALPAPAPAPTSGPAPEAFRNAFRSALQRYIDAAPKGFQAIGARDFVDWTPSVVLPAAQSCRGSGYPRDPVVECLLSRTDSEVEADDRFEDAIELVKSSLPAWTGDRVNASQAVFTGKGSTPIVGLGVTASGDHYDVEISVRPASQ